MMKINAHHLAGIFDFAISKRIGSVYFTREWSVLHSSGTESQHPVQTTASPTRGKKNPTRDFRKTTRSIIRTTDGSRNPRDGKLDREATARPAQFSRELVRVSGAELKVNVAGSGGSLSSGGAAEDCS